MADAAPDTPKAHAAELADRFIVCIDDYFNWLASYDLLRRTIPLGTGGGDVSEQLKVVRMKQMQARTDLLDTGRALAEAIIGIRYNTERLHALLEATEEGEVGIVRAVWPSVRAELEIIVEAAKPDEGASGRGSRTAE